MKYLTYDADASRRIFDEFFQDIGPDLMQEMVRKTLKATDNFEDRELTDLPPIELTAFVDQDGIKYESLELIATMRFVQDGETYLSNGYFAVNLAEALEEQEEIIEEFFPNLTKEN